LALAQTAAQALLVDGHHDIADMGMYPVRTNLDAYAAAQAAPLISDDVVEVPPDRVYHISLLAMPKALTAAA
jgi:hypothetical protein